MVMINALYYFFSCAATLTSAYLIFRSIVLGWHAMLWRPTCTDGFL